MNKENLVFNEEKGVFVDKYNGVEYVQIGENLAPLIGGGLPAELQKHNGKNYMVNFLGTFEVGDDGRVSSDSLKSKLDGSPLFFAEDGKLYSNYSSCRYELVDGRPVALYDSEHGIEGHIEEIDGKHCLVSEQGTYEIDEQGVVMTPREALFKTVKDVENEFFSEPERTETYLAASPAERKIMLDKFRREHGITDEMLASVLDEPEELTPQDDEMLRGFDKLIKGQKVGDITQTLDQMNAGMNNDVKQIVDEKTEGRE